MAMRDKDFHRRRIRDGRLREHEVLGLLAVDHVVVEDQEAVLAGDHGVLGRVLDALAARQDHPELALGVSRLEDPALGGDLGAEPDHQVLLAARRTDRHPVAVVRLVEDLDVLVLSGTELVPPHSVGPPRLVDRQVEDVPMVDRPRRTRCGVRNLVGQQLAGLEVLEPQRVPLVADHVHRVREQRAVVTERERAHREEVVSLGLGVAVEEHLLALDRRVGGQLRRCPVVRPGDGAPAVDAVLLALGGARVVPPVTESRRDRHVGLLRARLDLLEHLLPQRLQMLELLRGVRVLGLEVRDDLRILFGAEPFVMIDEGVPVMRPFERNPLGDRGRSRRRGHSHLSPPSPRTTGPRCARTPRCSARGSRRRCPAAAAGAACRTRGPSRTPGR